MKARERLIVALDVPEEALAMVLLDALAGQVGMFKVGSQLFTAAGADYLVVGRPITEAKDPAAAARAIVREMEGVHA